MSNVYAFTKADHGKSFTLKTDGFITVSLRENVTQPYRWIDASSSQHYGEEDEHTHGVIQLLNEIYTPSVPMTIGSGGLKVLIYQTNAVGTAKIELHLQSFNGDIGETFSIDVMLTED